MTTCKHTSYQNSWHGPPFGVRCVTCGALGVMASGGRVNWDVDKPQNSDHDAHINHDLKANIAAREDAEAVIACIADQQSLRFWQELKRMVDAKIAPDVEPRVEVAVHRPMNAIQARAFGQEVIRFGTVCQGKTVDEAYDEFNSWLQVVAHGTQFAKDLARYLAFREHNEYSVERDDYDLADPVQASRPEWLDKVKR